MSAAISVAPRLLVMKISAREKSTLRLSPSVSVALSRIPNSRFHRASDAFSISSNRIKLSLLRSEDQRAGEVDFAVVAQRERGFVQNTQQQIPQGIGCLFDFIEQDKTQLAPI